MKDLKKPFWGPWQTSALSFLIMSFYWMIQQSVVTAFSITGRLGEAGYHPLNMFRLALCNGNVLSTAVLLSAAACTGLTLFFTAARQKIAPLKSLGLCRVRPRLIFLFLAVTLAAIIMADSIKYLIGAKLVSADMLAAYRSARFKPLLWLAFCLSAPVFEEFMFRGFVITGLQNSRLGTRGAVMISAISWTAVHTQYGWPILLEILPLGIFFGWTRIRTGSILPALACHALVNIAATAQAAYLA